MTLPVQTSDLSDFGWNATAGRYTDLTTGRFVPFSAVRDELEHVIDAASERMATLSQSLLDNSVSLAEWQSGMMENVKIVHVASGASANGGWAQMSQSDWGFTGQRIRTQYDYLKNFAGQIADGTQQLNGQILVRANMYGDAGRGTFEEMRRRYEKQNNGMNFERRMLGVADHCVDCLDAAAEGWQPIGTLPEIGDSVCLTNCHCEFVYSETGEETQAEIEDNLIAESEDQGAAIERGSRALEAVDSEDGEFRMLPDGGIEWVPAGSDIVSREASGVLTMDARADELVGNLSEDMQRIIKGSGVSEIRIVNGEQMQEITETARGATCVGLHLEANNSILILDRPEGMERALIHETAHVLDLLGENGKYVISESKEWLEASGWKMNKKGEYELVQKGITNLVPTKYAATAPWEDFAESFTQANGTRFDRRVMAGESEKRYKFMKKFMKENYGIELEP